MLAGKFSRWLPGILLLMVFGVATVAGVAEPGWSAWQRFSERFVQDDGRVIDLTFDQKSTSEGQAYGLFFALVANRPAQFDTILKWTSDNLANGELGATLPGWLWGKREGGDWGLKDPNAASDADLWLAYSLLEAGRLWNQPRYTVLGRRILKLVQDHEVVRAGKAGTLLLPGPIGFALSGDRYRINPSYLPGFQLRYFATVDPGGPWADLWESYLQLAPQVFSRGVAPDLFVVGTNGVVTQDTERTPSGSYDAIRVYLWAGMSGKESQPLRDLLHPYALLMRTAGSPPENVNPATGAVLKADYLPIGFAGAALPFARALDDTAAEITLRNRLRLDAAKVALGGSSNYYDQALILFGQGWLDGVYRFDEEGRLQPRWLQ
jgi:endoglucanase